MWVCYQEGWVLRPSVRTCVLQFSVHRSLAACSSSCVFSVGLMPSPPDPPAIFLFFAVSACSSLHHPQQDTRYTAVFISALIRQWGT